MPETTHLEQDAAIEAHATRLFEARKNGTTTDLVTLTSPDITPSSARRIAAATLAKWGQPSCGIKLGYTSEAMRRQMGISEPNFGRLTADMDFSTGTIAPLVHPRAEPEVALRIGRDIDARTDRASDLIKLVDGVFPALEIVDTRYHDYVFRYEDNVADNSSAAGFVLGAPQTRQVLLDDGFAVRFETGDEQSLAGHSSDALGGPLHALTWLINELCEIGETLPAGSIILTGGLTSAPSLKRGQVVTAHFDRLGSVSFAW